MNDMKDKWMNNSTEELLEIFQPSPLKLKAWQQLPRQIRVEKRQSMFILVAVSLLVAVNIVVLNRRQQHKTYVALSQQYNDPVTTWYYE